MKAGDMVKDVKTGKLFRVAKELPKIPEFIQVQDVERIVTVDLAFMKKEDLELINED